MSPPRDLHQVLFLKNQHALLAPGHISTFGLVITRRARRDQNHPDGLLHWNYAQRYFTSAFKTTVSLNQQLTQRAVCLEESQNATIACLG